MKEVSIIEVDLAKQVFQRHGATSNGEVVFRKKLSRKQLSVIVEARPRCRVTMEARATAHQWARMLRGFGHEVRTSTVVRAGGFGASSIWPRTRRPLQAAEKVEDCCACSVEASFLGLSRRIE